MFLKRKAIKIWKEKMHHSLKPEAFVEVIEKNEVYRLSKLEHESIVKYYDFFIHDRHICVVLEYCEVNLVLKLI